MVRPAALPPRPRAVVGPVAATRGLRFAGVTALDVASRPVGVEASVRSLVERFDVADGRRLLGPATLANRQTSELLSMSGGRMLTASDGRLVIRDAATYTPLSRWDIRPGALAAHACQVAGGA